MRNTHDITINGAPPRPAPTPAAGAAANNGRHRGAAPAPEPPPHLPSQPAEYSKPTPLQLLIFELILAERDPLEIALERGLSMAQLLEIIESDEVQRELEAFERIADIQLRTTIIRARPQAAAVLLNIAVVSDKHETARKAAAALFRKSKRPTTTSADPPAPPPSDPTPTPPPTRPRSEPPPASPAHTPPLRLVRTPDPQEHEPAPVAEKSNAQRHTQSRAHPREQSEASMTHPRRLAPSAAPRGPPPKHCQSRAAKRRSPIRPICLIRPSTPPRPIKTTRHSQRTHTNNPHPS